jgi:apolipoprotein N-acyltransferase
MLEKIGAFFVMVATFFVLYWISELHLPLYITIFAVLVGTFTYLIGVVFLFAEGTILTSARRAKQQAEVRIEEGIEEAA